MLKELFVGISRFAFLIDQKDYQKAAKEKADEVFKKLRDLNESCLSLTELKKDVYKRYS